MLNLWRRHIGKCRQSTRTVVNKCSCPIWVEGSLHGAKVRRSLDLRSWEAAQKVVRDWEARQTVSVSLGEAFGRFLADCSARNLGVETVGKYDLLRREMTEAFGSRPVDSVSVEDLSRFRESWKLGPLSASKKIERMRTFYRFCLDRGWCEKNPAKAVRTPKVTQNPTLPFSDDELVKIRESVDAYPDRPHGRRVQLRAFILLLEHSGLRIRDVVTFSKDKISGGRMFLRTAKTGASVKMPLPPVVLEALDPLPARPFWSGECEPKSAVGDWQRTLARLFKIAGVPDAHPHRYRDSAAVKWLNCGVSLENVAALLGNSVKIVEKHYSPWVASRNAALEAEIIGKVWAVGA